MNAAFEHHRDLMLQVRQSLVRTEYRERMKCLAQGLYRSEAEALEGLVIEPPTPTDAEVRESIVSSMEWATRMREAAEKHGEQWGETVRQRWLHEAERIEAGARVALREQET